MSQPVISSSAPQPKFNREALTVYAAVALVAGLVDWGTKVMAVHFLTGNSQLLGSRFALHLVFNTAGAGGMSWGPHTWLINVVITLFAVLMISVVVGPLAAIDYRASWALGLVAGGATGNLVSMISGQEGVADFLAVRFNDSAIIANVADLALWTGALMLVPVVGSLLRAIRVERRLRKRPTIRYIEA